MEKVEDETSREVVEGAAAHMKTELTYHRSSVTLKIQSGPYSQTIQVKGSLRTQYTKRYWQMKRGAPPALSVMERTTRTGWSLRSPLGFKTKSEMNLDFQEE